MQLATVQFLEQCLKFIGPTQGHQKLGHFRRRPVHDALHVGVGDIPAQGPHFTPGRQRLGELHGVPIMAAEVGQQGNAPFGVGIGLQEIFDGARVIGILPVAKVHQGLGEVFIFSGRRDFPDGDDWFFENMRGENFSIGWHGGESKFGGRRLHLRHRPVDHHIFRGQNRRWERGCSGHDADRRSSQELPLKRKQTLGAEDQPGDKF